MGDVAYVARFTDTDNARRFAEEHGEELRYCWPWGRWIAWDGTRYVLEAGAQVQERAKLTVGRLGTDDDGESKEEARARVRAQSAAGVRAMLELARSEPGIPVDPDDLDADPFAFVAANGVLDLRTLELAPHDPERLVTRRSAIAWDPDAACPQWEAFLHRIMGGDTDLIAWLQCAVGYSLTADTSEQAIFFCSGTGANGKSTMLEVIRALVGDYGQQAPSELLMLSKSDKVPNELARLRGARFVTVVETGEGQWLDAVRLKRLSGDDTVTARFMRGEWFEFRPVAKLWLATNHLPRVSGADDAVWRRVRVVPFNVVIPEAERDPDLRAKLGQELPGILRWAAEGAAIWHETRLRTLTPAVVTATSSYRAEMDTLGAFLEARTVDDELAVTTAADLYAAWRAYCVEIGEHPWSQRRFGAAMRRRGHASRRTSGGLWVHDGLRLLQ